MFLLGFDIGGTKCAVMTADYENGQITLLDKKKIDTDRSLSPYEIINRLISLADEICHKKPEAVGISCGGPLDSKRGVILSPPNLPGWDNIPIVEIIKNHFGVPVHLQNDANACAVAEWKFGAGKGKNNVVFLTFGTGLGAGLILDGRLYSGTNDNAGEVGHIRLEKSGPVGYGKVGSFEGFCSGGGIAQLGFMMAVDAVKKGVSPAYYTEGMTPNEVTAKTIADAANAGDKTALEVYRTCGEHLGRGLSIIIDILNPEIIVIGSVFARAQNLLWDSARAVIEKEALPLSANVCRVVPAQLCEQIGDYAAIATALLEE
ncbi:MAG: ROK family protein [Ruminococcaceae bacterium]|nr:ROK family protein [Oscillospiraceae bacterium]